MTRDLSDFAYDEDARERAALYAKQRTKSKPPHPADGMTISVDVGGCTMEIIDPRSFKNGGPEWTMRYGDPVSIRYTVAGLLAAYDYLLSDNIDMKEATKRLRLMRAERQFAKENG